MKLSEWRKDAGYNQQQLADALQVTQPTISYWERSDDRALGNPKVPSPDLMKRIYTLTRGAVGPNDFYDLPPIDQLALPGLAASDSAPLLERAGVDQR